jgi:DNA-binding CsgD family transcriptional regulator
MTPGKATSKKMSATSAAADAGVLLLDLSFHPIAMDVGASSILAVMFAHEHGDEARSEPPPRVPAMVLEPMRGFEKSEFCPREMRFAVGNRVYRGRTYLVEPQDAILHDSCIVVHLERETDFRDALLEVSQKYHLTSREQEALSGIAIGLTSKELAERMKISPSTVKTFLRLIMLKTGAPNRAGIVAKLLGLPPSQDQSIRDSTEPAPSPSDE